MNCNVCFGPSGPKLDLLAVTSEFGDPNFVGKHPVEFLGMCSVSMLASWAKKCEPVLDFAKIEVSTREHVRAPRRLNLVHCSLDIVCGEKAVCTGRCTHLFVRSTSIARVWVRQSDNGLVSGYMCPLFRHFLRLDLDGQSRRSSGRHSRQSSGRPSRPDDCLDACPDDCPVYVPTTVEMAVLSNV